MRFSTIALLAALSMANAAAQTNWDTSGNGLLNGTYYFRQVAYTGLDPNTGSIGQALAVYGTITYDGKGSYSVTGQIMDSGSSSTTPQAYTTTGTYALTSSGLGAMSSLLVAGDSIIGLVSQGVFIGSSTLSRSVNDFFIAIPAASTPPTNSALNGNYWFASMNFPSGDTSLAADGLFQATANGSGGLSSPIAVTGYVGSSGSTVVTQTIQTASYSFSNGTATLTLPSTGSLVSGNKIMYVSADGNYLIAGAANAYDMIIGIKAATPPATNSVIHGLYYLSGFADNETVLVSQGYTELASFFGSENADGKGQLLRHQQNSPFDNATYNLMTDDTYQVGSNGSIDQPTHTSAAGVNGTAIVGINKGPVIGIFLGVKSPVFTGTGVYLDPTGIVNAASSAPFTSGIAPGELITLYGSNLANSPAVSAAPFPTSLGGVQVTINTRPAPIYYVSPTQISVIVPYLTELTGAVIQVINNKTPSNSAFMQVNFTSPGSFTVPPGGLGYSAVLHPDYSLVTKSNPAKPGETIQVFVTGLGAVTPSIADGGVGPTSPFSQTQNAIAVFFSSPTTSVQGNVTYSGLAPGLAGLYQLNVQIPTTVGAGDNYLEIEGPDSYATQALIPIQ